MHEPKKVSRRDWFRLHLPGGAARPACDRDPAVGEEACGLQSIEHPPNHDGMDLDELPPMREAVLGRDQVHELFADVEAHATEVLLMQRRGAPTSQSLSVARSALLGGDLPRIQIRYRWQGSLWIDTLESRPDGYRLVRIAHRGM